jgi:uncharacterized protein YqgC (DUF456 family)
MAYGWLGGAPIGLFTLGSLVLLALVGELIEFSLSARFTRQYGGSKRAGWGAIAGGIVGAIVGVPVPVIGSVIGAFVGSFVGALAAEWLQGAGARSATRVATGALLGRAAATAAKSAIGVVMAVWILFAAWGAGGRQLETMSGALAVRRANAGQAAEGMRGTNSHPAYVLADRQERTTT